MTGQQLPIHISREPPPGFLQEAGMGYHPVTGAVAGAYQVLQDVIIKKLIRLLSPPIP